MPIELFGARREVHDWHAGEGSFDVALAALSRGEVVVTPITRSNARVLSELPSLLRARAVALWILRLLSMNDDGPFPRLGLAVPSALAAADQARKLGIETRFVGIPLCALGPYAIFTLASPPRSYGARCEPCAARSQCPGVDHAYLQRFGEGELRTLSERIAIAPEPTLAARLR